MASKTLSNSNRFLSKDSARTQIVTNVSSSTAIETGKPASTYISRNVKSGRILAKSDSTTRKK